MQPELGEWEEDDDDNAAEGRGADDQEAFDSAAKQILRDQKRAERAQVSARTGSGGRVLSLRDCPADQMRLILRARLLARSP